MLDLNAGVDLDKVVTVLLIDEELSSACVAVLDVSSNFDGIVQNGLTNVLGKMSCWSHFDDLLMATLDRTITLKQMNAVTLSIGKKLDFNMPRPLEESFDENGSIAKCTLGFTDRTLKRILELVMGTNDTHSTTTTAHSGFNDDWEPVLFHKRITIGVGCDRAGGAGNDRNSSRDSYRIDESG
jgi:hypothetical protein